MQRFPPRAVPVLASLGLLLLLPGLAQSQGAATESGPLGCYELRVGHWDRDGYPVPSATSSRRPPDTFRLLADAAGRPGNGPKRYRVEPVELGEGNTGSWSLRGADSLAVTWSTGFVGVTLLFRIAADSLHGLAEAWSDDIEIDASGRVVRPKATAVARRVACGF